MQRQLIVMAVAVALAGCEQPKAVPGANGPAVTLAQFQKLQTGMTYAEAQKVLGSPGVEQSSGQIGDVRTAMFAWNGDGPTASMNATFQNDRLVTKAQMGLQ